MTAEPVEITEAAWHRALNSEPPAGRRNDTAGESFAAHRATYLRVNERHFRIGTAVSHAEACRLVGRSAAWRRPEESPAR